MQWLYYDVNHDVEDIFLTPKQYGFTNITGTCYETIQKNKNCEGYLFFDLVHSTAAAHQIMAEKAHHFLEKAGIEFISSTIPY